MISPERVEAPLIPRGPDGRGVRELESAWCLHRRLAIVDVGDESAQPFAASDGSILLYNGELYNFKELSTRVPNRRTSGDTEVIAELGADLREISRFRGIFAYVLIRPDGTVVMARDRFGVKPLYFAELDGSLVVASQIRSILPQLLNPTVRDSATSSLMTFGCVIGDPIVDEVRQVEPGEVIVWKDGRILSRNHVAASPPPTNLDLAGALRQSVARNLVSDVPTCILLSGGLDSAILAKLAAEAGEEPPIGVTLSVGGSIDEVDRARRTADRYGLKHEVVTYSTDHIEKLVSEFLDAMDQPSIDGLNVFLVTRAVRDLGFKVALSGLGSDEIFAGYDSDARLAILRLIRHLPNGLLRFVVSRVGGMNQSKVEDILARKNDEWAAMEVTRMIRTTRELDEMKVVPVASEPKYGFCEDRTINFNLGVYMVPMLLRDSDNYAMANSVELRVPFLDDDLVAIACARPQVARVIRRKKVLAAVLDDPYLRLVAREKKTGFRLPMEQWIRSLDLIQDGDSDQSWPRTWSKAVHESYVRRNLAG